jgi:hypothetical protein
MKQILFALLFVMICLAALLSGGYTYFGDRGTQAAREQLFIRGELLVDPYLPNKRQYPTKAGLENAPSNIAEHYKDSVRDGYVLAVQGDWDKAVMYLQSIVLLTSATAGLFSLKSRKSEIEN